MFKALARENTSCFRCRGGSSRHSMRSQFNDPDLIGRTLNGGRTLVRGTVAMTRRPWGFAIAQAEGQAAFLMRVSDPRLSVIAAIRTRIASPFHWHRSYGGTGKNHSCRAAARTTFSFARRLLVTFSSGPKMLATNPKLVGSLRLCADVGSGVRSDRMLKSRKDSFDKSVVRGEGLYCSPVARVRKILLLERDHLSHPQEGF